MSNAFAKSTKHEYNLCSPLWTYFSLQVFSVSMWSQVWFFLQNPSWLSASGQIFSLKLISHKSVKKYTWELLPKITGYRNGTIIVGIIQISLFMQGCNQRCTPEVDSKSEAFINKMEHCIMHRCPGLHLFRFTKAASVCSPALWWLSGVTDPTKKLKLYNIFFKHNMPGLSQLN